MKKVLILFLLILPSFAHAQTQKQWMKHADKSYQEKDYYGASLYYRRAMLVDSSNLFVVYRYAECLRQYNEYKLAENYYWYVYNKDKGKTFQENLFWLGEMQKYNAKYIEARKSFIQFVNTYKQKESYFYKKAQHEVKSCEFALEIIKKPVSVQVFNIGDSLNTVNAEFGALSINDSTLYFSSLYLDTLQKRKNKADKNSYAQIYLAEKTDTLWKTKKELDSIVNKNGVHNANGSFSKDGQKFFFSRCDNDLHCEIYVSELVNEEWQQAKKLNDKINIPSYISTQPCITSIDTTEILFFVSDRPGGQGKLDIWYSFKEGNEFTEAVNAGTNINSLDDELSPWFDKDNKTLYFSSSWHNGLGGQDIFKCTSDSDGFSKPINIGYPINSSVNDLYYIYNIESTSGFLTSNREGAFSRKGETCCNDIWYYQYPKIIKKDSIPVVKIDPLKELVKFIPIKLYFHNDEPNPRTKDTISSIDYLASYRDYISMIDLYKENYSKGLEAEKKKIAEDSIISFFESHVAVGSRDLEAITEVLLRQLERGYKLDLTVKGHASSLAKTDYNIQLTLRRISSLENYLREYKGGIFVPYLADSASNGGRLNIIKIPFGEYKAHQYLSDNLNDKKNSVYSIAAALHRNIEIVSVTLEHKDSSTAQISFRKEIFDFGNVKEGAQLSHSFKFKNTGKRPLVISDIFSECECITEKVNSSEILPGESGEIQIRFDTKGLKGKQLKTVILHTNAFPTDKELSITIEVK